LLAHTVILTAKHGKQGENQIFSETGAQIPLTAILPKVIPSQGRPAMRRRLRNEGFAALAADMARANRSIREREFQPPPLSENPYRTPGDLSNKIFAFAKDTFAFAFIGRCLAVFVTGGLRCLFTGIRGITDWFFCG
jgi:hypothetical protein